MRPSQHAPLAYLATSEGFNDAYDRIRFGTLDGGLSVPWLAGPALQLEPGKRFWKYYLGRPPEYATWKNAWRSLVPIREKLDWGVEATWLPGRVDVERYYYPYGRAVVLTFNIPFASGLSVPPLEHAVQLTYQVRRGGVFTVTLAGSERVELDLDTLAKRALEEGRRRACGDHALPGSVSLAPFSVLTFIQLDQVDHVAEFVEGGEVHKALHVLTTWDPLYPAASTQAPEEGVIPAGFPPGSAFYGAPRGRTVWVPIKAADPASRYLSCYHRTLVFLSLQLESIGAFVKEAAGISSLNKEYDLHEIAKFATGLLGRLHGQKDTFRNPSCPRHIEQNDWIHPLDKLREALEWTQFDRR